MQSSLNDQGKGAKSSQKPDPFRTNYTIATLRKDSDKSDPLAEPNKDLPLEENQKTSSLVTNEFQSFIDHKLSGTFTSAMKPSLAKLNGENEQIGKLRLLQSEISNVSRMSDYLQKKVSHA